MAKTSSTANRRPTRATTRRSRDRELVSWEIPWTTPNFIGVGIGIVVIVIGYLLMKTAIAADPIHDKSIWNNANSTSIAPIVLTVGYCIIMPIAIFWRKKNPSEEEVSES